MKAALATVPSRPFNPCVLALGLSLGLALAPCRLAAADATNTALPASQTPPPTKLVVPPEWAERVEAAPQEYRYDGLPLAEVVVHLQEQCKHRFDVLMPEYISIEPVGPGGSAEAFEPGALAIKLRLKDARIVEVFQAMNMLFELEGAPARWELVMNGHRPVAVLRPLPIKAPPADPARSLVAGASARAVSRSVIFVGDLLGGTGVSAMKPDALCRTLVETATETLGPSDSRKIQYHAGAELLVLSGTDEDLRFMKDVLEALKEKSDYQRRREPAPAPDAPAKR
ncbi:MAG TPA: hypothetical protein P5205_11165 [Candidatus Paceibacterota bacterium]|nr:hypothetical protein [Verrucomicrobiota bacterium]HSA10917.1 hypothetical protein [Candidatus Paceibacterota bacterium]